MPLPTAGLYCSDEDVALRAPGDFAQLCPRSLKYASGADGVIASGAPWTLTSSAVLGQLAALTSGMVVELTTPGKVGPAAPFGAGELLAVDSASSAGAVLRRLGEAAGVGTPPGAPSGVAGVAFNCRSLVPVIRRACFDLDRRFGVDDLITGRRTADLYDPVELAQATVLLVLSWQYEGLARDAGKDGDFWKKREAIEKELDDLIARSLVHWRPITSTGTPGQASSRFTTRIVR